MNCVDVVIPCYKYAGFLRHCVRSVLDQPGVAVKVLIIDDCSPDHTPDVAAQLVKEDSRVAYRRHAVNRGHIATYNEGLLEWATSEYCLLLSADDALTNGALQRAVRVMDQNPNVGLAYGKAIETADPVTYAGAIDINDRCTILSGAKFVEQSCYIGSNVVPTPSAVCRTRIQKVAGGYRSDLPHSGDMEMWLRFGALADVAVLEADQAYYRVHGTNMHVAYAGSADLFSKQAAFDVFFAQYGNKIADAKRLRRIAKDAVAELAFVRAYDALKAGDLERSRAHLRDTATLDGSRWFQHRYLWAWMKALLRPRLGTLKYSSSPDRGVGA